MLPYIGFHANTIVCMLSKKRQPDLHIFGVTVLYLYQPPECDPFEVLLTPFVDEVTPGHRPSLSDPG